MILQTGKVRNRLENSNRFFACRFCKRLAGASSFTLIEILLVIILLGVVAGLSVPEFTSAYDQLILSETAKDVSYLMRYVQNRAVVKSKKHKFYLDLKNSAYWLEEAQAEESGDIQESENNFSKISGRFGRIFTIPEGISAESAKTEIYFYPDGTIDKTRIYLYNRKKKYFTISTQEQDGSVQNFDFKVE